jgi:hypothetical protein
MNNNLRVVSANFATVPGVKEQCSLHLTCSARLVTVGDVVEVVQSYLEEHRAHLGLDAADTVRVSLSKNAGAGQKSVWQMDLRSVHTHRSATAAAMRWSAQAVAAAAT